MNGSYQVKNYFQELQLLRKSLVTISESSPLQDSRRDVLAVCDNNNPCQQTRRNSVTPSTLCLHHSAVSRYSCMVHADIRFYVTRQKLLCSKWHGCPLLLCMIFHATDICIILFSALSSSFDIS
jgi:hypothetical protein